MSRNLVSFGLQLLWLVAACDSGGLDSHRFQVPAKLTFTTPPKAGIAGGGIAWGRIRPDVVVTVLDENDKPVTRPRPGEFIVDAGVATPDGGAPEGSIQVTLALGNNAGGGTLVGTLTAVTVNGVATFPNLYLDKPGTGYTLVAEAAGLKATSEPFKVTFPPSKLVFQVQPGPTTPVEAITPPVEVAVFDVQGSLVEAASMSVRLDLQPPDVTVAGNSAEVSNGVAIFPNLVIPKPGKGYTLTAWAPGMSTTSAPFNVGGFVAISAGSYTCGIDLAGATYCWGGDFPPTPAALAGGLSFTGVTVGDRVGCGLTAAGAAHCWGDAFSSTPVAIVGGLPFATVSGSCGVLTTGAAYCWGENAFGQLGNGSTSSSSAPVAVAGGLTFASLSSGASYNCGVTTTGAAYCWGDNSYGRLGNGSSSSLVPAAVAGGLTFVSVSAGLFHSCGVTTAGAAYCWGLNNSGQLGNGESWDGEDYDIFSSTPVAVAGGLTFATVSAGGEHSCGVTTAGETYCWGRNDSGELGTGSTSRLQSTPVAVAGGLTFATVSTGGFDPWGGGLSRYSCGVTTTGEAYCWGRNDNGELGNGSTTSSSTPVAVTGGLTFASVSTGPGHTCGLTTAGAAYCWGYNYFGELGNGSATNSTTPVAVAGGLTFASVSADALPSGCGVTTAGEVYCWGASRSRTPVALAGGITFASLSAGANHSCGVTSAGVAYCWGFNDSGQLGNGSTTNSETPVVVAGGLRFATVSAGGSHTCGVTSAGPAYCWGSNVHGELGDGLMTNSSVPVAVAGGPRPPDAGIAGPGPVLTFSSVSAGALHSCGVTTTGLAYCWGDDSYGALGDSLLPDGTTGPRSRPVAVSGGLSFATVSAEAVPLGLSPDRLLQHHTCGVTTTGVAYCWGSNFSGALGNGSTNWISFPGAVGGGLTFASVSAGGWHSCGLTTTGGAYCWGANYRGELGIGSDISSTVWPTRVPIP